MFTTKHLEKIVLRCGLKYAVILASKHWKLLKALETVKLQYSCLSLSLPATACQKHAVGKLNSFV